MSSLTKKNQPPQIAQQNLRLALHIETNSRTFVIAKVLSNCS